MKKIISLVLCASMMSSLVLCGCQKSKNEKETKKETTTSEENTGKQSATDAETEKTEDTTVPSSRGELHFDKDKLQQLVAYCDSKKERDSQTLGAYADGIRGEVIYSVHADQILFAYEAADTSITLHIYPEKETASLTFDLHYGDDRYYGTTPSNMELGLGDFESFIDSVIICDKSVVDVHDDAAFASNSETIAKDIPILYSRLITIAENAFPELGFGLEDLGLDFGSKYRDIDPGQIVSQEIEIVNDHVFVDGVCRDCKMTWPEYFYETVKKIDGDKGEFEYLGHSIDGQKSSYNFSASDTISLRAEHEDDATVSYKHMELHDDVHSSDEWKVNITESRGMLKSDLEVSYEQGFYSTGTGVSYKYEYYLELTADAGEYDEVFSSKKDFIKNCKAELRLWEGDDPEEWGKNLWDSMSDSEIKKMFDEEPGNTYLTEEEFIDYVWERCENVLESMDYSMIWLDTSLEDAGFNWK